MSENAGGEVWKMWLPKTLEEFDLGASLEGLRGDTLPKVSNIVLNGKDISEWFLELIELSRRRFYSDSGDSTNIKEKYKTETPLQRVEECRQYLEQEKLGINFFLLLCALEKARLVGENISNIEKQITVLEKEVLVTEFIRYSVKVNKWGLDVEKEESILKEIIERLFVLKMNVADIEIEEPLESKYLDGYLARFEPGIMWWK